MPRSRAAWSRRALPCPKPCCARSMRPWRANRWMERPKRTHGSAVGTTDRGSRSARREVLLEVAKPGDVSGEQRSVGREIELRLRTGAPAFRQSRREARDAARTRFRFVHASHVELDQLGKAAAEIVGASQSPGQDERTDRRLGATHFVDVDADEKCDALDHGDEFLERGAGTEKARIEVADPERRAEPGYAVQEERRIE